MDEGKLPKEWGIAIIIVFLIFAINFVLFVRKFEIGILIFVFLFIYYFIFMLQDRKMKKRELDRRLKPLDNRIKHNFSELPEEFP